ncbi:MAG: tRNA-dihydrouridine synthase family protein [Nanobdellota archaeon]
MILYFAPINLLGNHAFRHFLLKHGADHVFTELILERDLFDNQEKRNKLTIIKGDEARTIVQIGSGDAKAVARMVEYVTKSHPDVPEINMNMGCPQSTLVREVSCGGLLKDIEAMSRIAGALVDACRLHRVTPSVKVRLGPDNERDTLEDYASVLEEAGIKKIYVHARRLGQGYHLPADYAPIKEVITHHPDVEFIVNGDVDSYAAASKVMNETGCHTLMIGRAALHNLLVFEHIKNEVPSRTQEFAPLINDPSLETREDGKTYCAQEKLYAIKDFIDISMRNELPAKTAKRNIMMMLKGISDVKLLLREINEAKSLSEIKISLEKHPFT